MSDNSDYEDISRIKQKIILLKREIEHLKFKNSRLFKVLNLVNLFIFLIYIQYILTYLSNQNSENISNAHIQFNVYSYQSERIKLYTIKFKYHNYFFRVKINRELDKTIMYTDAVISKDLIFQIPQKLQLKNFRSHWFFINESLGILTICFILVFVQTVAYIYKQNEHYYPLLSVFVLNILSFTGIVIFSLHIHNLI